MLQVSRGDLIAASKAGNVSLVKALLAAGADKDEKDTVRGRIEKGCMEESTRTSRF